MAVRKAYAAERRHVTLLCAMAGSFTIKASLGLACGRKVILSATLPTGFRLRRIPETAELTSDKSLSRDRSFHGHARGANTIQNGVRHAVSPERNNSAVMAQTADNNRVRELVGQLVNLYNGNFILAVSQKDRAPGNLDGLFI